ARRRPAAFEPRSKPARPRGGGRAPERLRPGGVARSGRPRRADRRSAALGRGPRPERAPGRAFPLTRRVAAAGDACTAGDLERTADVGRRLPEPQTADEVGRLASTLNRMLAALERARENERRFLADASHELRSPVTALRGNADYLRRHGYDAEVVADLGDDAERLSTLIDDLLMLSPE